MTQEIAVRTVVRVRLGSPRDMVKTMHKLLPFILVGVLLSQPSTIHVEAETVNIQKTFKEELLTANITDRQAIIKKHIEGIAQKYHIDGSLMYKVITCENNTLNPDRQSELKYPYDVREWSVRKGEQEKSYGLAMIHLPSHPNISLQQATDPDFALDFMGKEFSSGRASQWACYRKVS